MPIWTLIGLTKGTATTSWPAADGDDGQGGILGMPRISAEPCLDHCAACAQVCPTNAIAIDPDAHLQSLDYGRCIACQLCVEACPSGTLKATGDWAFGVRDRDDLRWNALAERPQTRHLRDHIERSFRGSLHVRHVDAGSCNGCESELQALNNPFYNLHRLGIFFTASPRFADLLLVTGPVTHVMREALINTYAAMPEPRLVMAVGTCAVSGGIAAGGYACGNGLEGILPVDLWLPGCPPNPAAIIDALLVLLQRREQHIREGHAHE